MPRCATNAPTAGATTTRFAVPRLPELQALPAASSTVYFYIVSTMSSSGEALSQSGSGPNVDGSRITLCTCKRAMRTALNAHEWKGTWVAGYSSIARLDGRPVHYLAYLMRVSETFLSQRDLWNSLSETDRRAKSARTNPHGDVYEPKPDLRDPYDPQHYQPPHRGHSHWKSDGPRPDWYSDIRYRSRSGKPAILLVGDVEHSYLWKTPTLYTTYFADSGGYRGHRSLPFNAFLDTLHES